MFDSAIQKLDFDSAAKLAVEDPEAFEQRRRDAIEQLIENAPERNRERLRKLQWKIDQIREHSPNPLAATVKLYDMMWDSFAGEQGMITLLKNPHQLEEQPGAQVLRFQRG